MCFETPGVEQFKPGDGANPALGKIGELERVEGEESGGVVRWGGGCEEGCWEVEGVSGFFGYLPCFGGGGWLCGDFYITLSLSALLLLLYLRDHLVGQLLGSGWGRTCR